MHQNPDNPQPGSVRYLNLDILASRDHQAIVNPVNCVGTMGAGLALQFVRRFPEILPLYQEACRSGQLKPGAVLLHHRSGNLNPLVIVHFPTKLHWRNPSQLDWIETGLTAMYDALRQTPVQSVALPALGAGLGGLPWPQVRTAIKSAAARNPEVTTTVYLPLPKPK